MASEWLREATQGMTAREALGSSLDGCNGCRIETTRRHLGDRFRFVGASVYDGDTFLYTLTPARHDDDCPAVDPMTRPLPTKER